jgi:hypothetical protein
MLELRGITRDEHRHSTVSRKWETQAFLDAYRERMANHVPSDEERFEMRAAFGEGVEVVNVITGKVTRT